MPIHPDLDTTCTRHRTILDLRHQLPSQFLLIGHYQYHRAMPPLPEQSSNQRLVIAIMVSGIQNYRVGEENILLRGGMGIRLLPGQSYGTADSPEHKGELIWLTFEKPSAKNASLPGLQSQDLPLWWDRALSTDTKLTFPIPANTIEHLLRIIRPPHQILQEMAASNLSLQLGTILLDLYHAFTHPAEENCSPSIRKALTMIEATIASDPPTLEDLTRASGLSESNFYRTFRQEIGTSPADYLARRRIIEAQKLLRTGKSVTWVSAQLGFSSSQYFSTVFKRYTTHTPQEWRKRFTY